MKKLDSIDALKKYKTQIKYDSRIRVKVALATCSKVAGAGAILDFFTSAVEKRGLDAEVSITGCMGYCYAEPTVEITLPGRDPVVFGDVTVEKADQIIEKYMKRGEQVEGEIPVNYLSIQEIN